MWLVCLCVGLVVGQMMMIDSGVMDGGMMDDGSMDNLVGQMDVVEVLDIMVVIEENIIIILILVLIEGQGFFIMYLIIFI